jgi:hypothetical protein
MVRHEAGVQHIRVDVEVEPVARLGEAIHRRRQGRQRLVQRDDRHVGRRDQLPLLRVEVAHVDHDDPIGGQRHDLAGQAPPVGVGQPGRHRHRHAAEAAGDRRARRVEVAVGVEPDQAHPRRRAMRRLEAGQRPDHRVAGAAGEERPPAGAQPSDSAAAVAPPIRPRWPIRSPGTRASSGSSTGRGPITATPSAHRRSQRPARA